MLCGVGRLSCSSVFRPVPSIFLVRFGLGSSLNLADSFLQSHQSRNPFRLTLDSSHPFPRTFRRRQRCKASLSSIFRTDKVIRYIFPQIRSPATVDAVSNQPGPHSLHFSTHRNRSPPFQPSRITSIITITSRSSFPSRQSAGKK
jgi:hypothetical protein